MKNSGHDKLVRGVVSALDDTSKRIDATYAAHSEERAALLTIKDRRLMRVQIMFLDHLEGRSA